MKNNSKVRKVGILLFWLILWQVVAGIMHNDILLVGPVEVFVRLATDSVTSKFWYTVALSLGRISAGFLGAFALGSLFGVLAYRFPMIREFLEPLMSAVKSVPVASFVVILLIWFGSEQLSIWISFLIVLPNLYFQMLEGLHATDRRLLEMGKVYSISSWNKAWYIYRPAVAPFLLSGCKVSVGMAWKSGVAAEIIGLPRESVGEQIYMSKIYLDTAGVLSWTLVCIILSFAAEKVFLYLLKKGLSYQVPMWCGKKISVQEEKVQEETEPRTEVKNTWNAQVHIENSRMDMDVVHVEDICKSYGATSVLQQENMNLKPGHIYALIDPSGAGKTTMLRILAGLESPDAGVVTGVPEHIGMVFQEMTCLRQLDAIGNLELVCGKKEAEEWNSLMREVGLAELQEKQLGQFSGGMARRVEILRCVLSSGTLLLMDEPFNGLDQDTRKRVIAFIRKYQRNRTILFTTHKIEEVKEMEAEILSLNGAWKLELDI